MRTTVDLDPDLLARVRGLAATEGVSFRDALARVVRRGLEVGAPTPTRRYRCPVFHLGAPRAGRSLDKALALADELEAGEVVAELERRK